MGYQHMVFDVDGTLIDSGEILYIGDTVYDSQCAHGAGVDFALALWGTLDPTIPARHRLEDPVQLLEL